MSAMTHRTLRSIRHVPGRARCVTALVLGAAVIVQSGTVTASSHSPAAATATATDTAPVTEQVLDGWFSYQLAPGWAVVAQATELQRFRQDFDAPAITETRPQLLLYLSNGTAGLVVVREMNFLHVDDELAWRDTLAVEVAGPDAQVVGTDTVPGTHGPIHRSFLEGDGTYMVASSLVGEQVIGVVVDLPSQPDPADLEAIDAMLGSLQFDPDFALPRLLNFHGAWAWRETFRGQRLIELDYDLPSDWLEVSGGHPTESSADGTAWIQVVFWDDDGMTVAERIDDVVDAVLTVGDDAPVVEGTVEIIIDGFVFTLAVVSGVALAELGPTGPDSAVASTAGATGTAAVAIADVGAVDVEVVMLNSTSDPDVDELFEAIVDSFVLRAWDADGTSIDGA